MGCSKQLGPQRRIVFGQAEIETSRHAQNPNAAQKFKNSATSRYFQHHMQLWQNQAWSCDARGGLSRILDVWTFHKSLLKPDGSKVGSRRAWLLFTICSRASHQTCSGVAEHLEPLNDRSFLNPVRRHSDGFTNYNGCRVFRGDATSVSFLEA